MNPSDTPTTKPGSTTRFLSTMLSVDLSTCAIGYILIKKKVTMSTPIVAYTASVHTIQKNGQATRLLSKHLLKLLIFQPERPLPRSWIEHVTFIQSKTLNSFIQNAHLRPFKKLRREGQQTSDLENSAPSSIVQFGLPSLPTVRKIAKFRCFGLLVQKTESPHECRLYLVVAAVAVPQYCEIKRVLIRNWNHLTL